MKKVIVLTLAGAMIFSTPVMAKEVGAPVAEYLEESSYVGVPAETVLAIDQDKLIGEHMNNAVVDIWSMDGEQVQNLAIGKGAVLDGVEAPGLTFDLVKPDLKRVYAAKALAESKTGTLLSVVNVHTHVAFANAKVTFYAPGVTAGQAITVYERIDDENWVACPTEVADNQVVVDITGNGHLAFIGGEAAAETKVVAEPKAAVETEVVAEPKAAAEAEVAADTKATVETAVLAEAETKAEVKVEAKEDADTEEKEEDKEGTETVVTTKTETEDVTVTDKK